MGAAKLRRMRVPASAARSAQTRPEWIRHPFPDVAGAIAEAVGAASGGKASDRERVPRAAPMMGASGIPIVAPGIAPAVLAAGGALPFRFRREPRLCESRERFRLVPAHADDGLIGSEIGAPARIVPEPWPLCPRARPPLPSCLAPQRTVGIPMCDEPG